MSIRILATLPKEFFHMSTEHSANSLFKSVLVQKAPLETVTIKVVISVIGPPGQLQICVIEISSSPANLMIARGHVGIIPMAYIGIAACRTPLRGSFT